MDLEDLRTFVQVADAGGVSAAASRTGLSKSIISRRLTRLEAELGVQLLVRSVRGTLLTDSGVSFREFALRASVEMEMAMKAVCGKTELSGRLRVAVPLSDCEMHFTPVLADMAHRHPGLKIDVSYSDRVVDLIADGFDCAVRVGSLPDSSLLAKRVGSIAHRLVASPNYIAMNGLPTRLRDLSSHRTLIGTQAWEFEEHGEIVTIQTNGQFKADSSPALATAAVSGLGIAYLPASVSQQLLASGALVPVLERYPIPSAAVYLVRPNSPYIAETVRVFSDLLIGSFSRPRDASAAGASRASPITPKGGDPQYRRTEATGLRESMSLPVT